jgi:uncharacterized protein YrrD
MIKRTSDLMGKPVLSADTGVKLGTVADLLFDDDGGQFVGLVLKQGMLKSEQVLPAASIRTLGTDAVVSRSSELVGAREWTDRNRAAEGDPGERPVVALDEPPRRTAG